MKSFKRLKKVSKKSTLHNTNKSARMQTCLNRTSSAWITP